MCGKLHILGLLVGLASALMAAPIPPDVAARRAEAWLMRRPESARGRHGKMRPARKPSGRVRTYGVGGTNLFHLVALEGGGFVAVSAADGQAPVVGFSTSDELPTPDDGGPLWALLKADAAARASGRSAASLMGSVANESGIDDVRVSPLVQSKWDQRYVGGKATYNYYTTNHWYCGCVATAMAQLMRYHGFPSNAVTPRTFTCYIVSTDTPVSLTMKGGAYDWANMPLVPTSAIADTEREAIGRICYDAGVSMRMQYSSSGSGALPFEFDPLRNVFGFASAHTYLAADEYTTLTDGEVKNGILANLDAGCPVLLAINNASATAGHAILADGYGYVDGTLYCHLNMGWSGSYNYWYALPAIPAGGYNFTVVNAITYNVFPDRTGEIVSGRVTDQSGHPLAGAEVSASVFYTSRSGGWFSSRLKTNVVSTVTAMTGATGVYALYAPTNRTYSVLLSATYEGATTNAITATTSPSVSPTSVNWETGNYYYSGSGLSIGNSWGNDFVITVKSKFNGIIFR